MQIVSSVQYTVDSQYILSGINEMIKDRKIWMSDFGKVSRGDQLVPLTLENSEPYNTGKNWSANISTVIRLEELPITATSPNTSSMPIKEDRIKMSASTIRDSISKQIQVSRMKDLSIRFWLWKTSKFLSRRSRLKDRRSRKRPNRTWMKLSNKRDFFMSDIWLNYFIEFLEKCQKRQCFEN